MDRQPEKHQRPILTDSKNWLSWNKSIEISVAAMGLGDILKQSQPRNSFSDVPQDQMENLIKEMVQESKLPHYDPAWVFSPELANAVELSYW